MPMLLPATVRKNLKEFSRKVAHQSRWRQHFDLTDGNQELLEQITSAVSVLLSKPFASADKIALLQIEAKRLSEKKALSYLELAERGLVELGLNDHVAALKKLLQFILSDSGLESPAISDDRQKFSDPKLEKARVDILALWYAAQSKVVDEHLIEKIAQLLDIKFVSPAEYDVALVEQITNSPIYQAQTEDPNLMLRLGSDGDLQKSADERGVDLKFYFWTLSTRDATLAFSSEGILEIPNPPERYNDPVARRWPSRKFAFIVSTDIAERNAVAQRHLKNFTKSVKTISDMQNRLQPWLGASVAGPFAGFFNLTATYRMFLHLGGFGCSNFRVLQHWGVFLLTSLILLFVANNYDLKSIFYHAFAFREMIFPKSGWAVLTVLSFLFLCIVAIVNLVSGVAVLHGTVLRGLDRQYIPGSTNLPGTGKTNFILKLMKYKNHSR